MNSRLIGGSIIILFGLSFLFEFPFIKIFFALLIIYIGVKVLSGKTGGIPFTTDKKTKSSEDYVNRVLIFSGMKTNFESKDFKGAEVVAIFGDGELDLSKVSTKQDQLVLKFVAIVGALKVIVPKSWNITTEGVGILGTFNNNTSNPSKPKTKVVIEGAAILGGIDIIS